MTQRRTSPGSGRSRQTRNLARAPKKLRERRRILIVCEGRETEYNYFRGLKREEDCRRQRFVLKVVRGKGGSARDTVEKAVSRQTQGEVSAAGKYDEVWCIIDVEILEKHHAKPLKEAREMAQREGIKLALSNPCFEYWLLLHLEKSARVYSTTDKLRRDLNRAWKKLFRSEYEKTNPEIYAKLASGRDGAVANAREMLKSDVDSENGVVARNPSTNVYRLVEHLLAGAPEEPG